MNPEIVLDVQMLETVLAAEFWATTGRYQILATIGAAVDGVDRLGRALRESINGTGAHFPPAVPVGIPGSTLTAPMWACNPPASPCTTNCPGIPRHVLKSQLRICWLPLLDSKTHRGRTGPDRAAGLVRAKSKLGSRPSQSSLSVIRGCSVRRVCIDAGDKSLEEQMDRCLNESDPLLRETARAAKTPSGCSGREP